MSVSKNALQKLANDKIDVVDGLHDVPSQNSVTNSQLRDVVGNKTDTAGGSSIFSQNVTMESKVDVIDGYHDVPIANSADNNQMRDVIGNKTDGHSSISLSGKTKLIEEHLHNTVFLYPDLAGSVELEKASGAWAAHPTPVQIIPAGTITEDFDLHFLNVSAISANGEYSIRLYTGAALNEVLIGTYGAVRNAVQSQEGSRTIITPLFPANTRISASLSSENVGLNTLNIKVEGHTY